MAQRAVDVHPCW